MSLNMTRAEREPFLADLHVGSPFNGLDKLEAVTALTQKAAPDLVLLAGDYVVHGVLGGRFHPPEAVAEVLGRLEAPAGIYAVLGNHDWWLDAARVTRALESVSIPALEDLDLHDPVFDVLHRNEGLREDQPV